VSNVSVADWIVIGEFIAALAALVAFVLFYTLSSHGRALRSPEGRHLLNFRLALIAWMVMGIIHNLIETYPARDIVRVVVIGWFACAAAQGTFLVIRAQQARRRTIAENARSGR
jgi:hypothetical protein